ncbi:MAG: hypothetical protein GY757_10055 [bacterium]|nr:hypothetical protein [bacterium]
MANWIEERVLLFLDKKPKRVDVLDKLPPREKSRFTVSPSTKKRVERFCEGKEFNPSDVVIHACYHDIRRLSQKDSDKNKK